MISLYRAWIKKQLAVGMRIRTNASCLDVRAEGFYEGVITHIDNYYGHLGIHVDGQDFPIKELYDHGVRSPLSTEETMNCTKCCMRIALGNDRALVEFLDADPLTEAIKTFAHIR